MPQGWANGARRRGRAYCFAPFSGRHPIGGITSGPDGNLWFTESTRIGRMTPQGAITEFARPESDSTPGPIVAGPDGNLWFVERAAKALARISPQGIITQFALPGGATSPVGLASGPDGALWYTRSPTAPAAEGGPPNLDTPGLIGRMTISGRATEFSLPTPPAPRPPGQPRDIIAGPDGALWFDTGTVDGVASGNSWIGRLTTSGQVTIVYAPDPRALVSITGLAAGPDQRIWFTLESSPVTAGGTPGQPLASPPQVAGSIGCLTSSGQLQLFPLPSSLSTAPGTITAGPDGNLWFVASPATMGRITPSGQVTTFSLPDAQAEIGPLTQGPGHALWFTQTYDDTDLVSGFIWGTKIGRMTP